MKDYAPEFDCVEARDGRFSVYALRNIIHGIRNYLFLNNNLCFYGAGATSAKISAQFESGFLAAIVAGHRARKFKAQRLIEKPRAGIVGAQFKLHFRDARGQRRLFKPQHERASYAAALV